MTAIGHGAKFRQRQIQRTTFKGPPTWSFSQICTLNSQTTNSSPYLITNEVRALKTLSNRSKEIHLSSRETGELVPVLFCPLYSSFEQTFCQRLFLLFPLKARVPRLVPKGDENRRRDPLLGGMKPLTLTRRQPEEPTNDDF